MSRICDYDHRTVTNEERYGNVTVRNVSWEKWDRWREKFIQGICYEVLYGDECIAELDPDGVIWAEGESFERLIWNMAIELAYDMACMDEFQEWSNMWSCSDEFPDCSDSDYHDVILVEKDGDLEVRWETFDSGWSVPDEGLRYESLVAVFHVCEDESARRKVIKAAHRLQYIMERYIETAWDYYGLCDESKWIGEDIISDAVEEVEHVLNPRMTIVECLDEEHFAIGYALFVDGRFQVIAERPEEAINLWRFKSGEVPLYE